MPQRSSTALALGAAYWMNHAASRGKSMVGPTRINTLNMVSRKGVSICPVAMIGRISGASTTMARLLRKA